MFSVNEATEEFRRLSGLLERGLTELRQQAHAVANAEADYRRAKAQKWMEAPVGQSRGEWTAAQREAWVNGETADLRQARDLADGLRSSATESVRSRRTQISALQSLLAADRAELEFARTGPS